MPLPQPQGYTVYTVAMSDTLESIATRFGSNVRGIAELNGLPSNRPLRIEQALAIPVYQQGTIAVSYTHLAMIIHRPICAQIQFLGGRSIIPGIAGSWAAR